MNGQEPAAAGLWRRQIAAVLRLELRKGFTGRRGFGLYLLALASPAIFLLRAVLPHAVHDPSAIADATMEMAQTYQSFLLRVIIFLGCVAIFGNLIRREILDRSLHFYFLAPLRRDLLVVAKYLTGLLVSFILFGAYLLVTFLGCAGYGAVFLAAGFFFRSPAIPALALFGWEAIHFLLPPVLKQLSVIHYLQALCPVPLSEGPFALLSNAPSTAASILGLLLLTLALLALAAQRIRRMEVAYLDD